MPSHRPFDPQQPIDGWPSTEKVPDNEQVIRFVTDQGVPFSVREEPEDPLDPSRSGAGARPKPGRGCLVFESDVITYRVYSYPADWRGLGAEQLTALAIESRPPQSDASRLAPPTIGSGGALELIDDTGERWRIVEDVCGRISDPTARTRRCLVFTTALFVRRIYDFPAEWARLSSEALIALSSGQPTGRTRER